jgi:hypothetical protein
MGPKGVSDTKTDGLTDHGAQHKLNSVIALQTADPPSRQRGRSTETTAAFRHEVISGRKSQSGLDTKTY